MRPAPAAPLPIVPRYLLREVLRTFLTSLGGLSLFLVPPAALSALHKLGGVGPEVLVGYLPLLAAQLLPHLVPIAFLLGITRCAAGLVARREWLALEMSGRHPLRTLVPVAVVALGMSLLSLAVLHRELPALRYDQAAYQRDAAVEAARRSLVGRTAISLGGFHVVGQSLDETGIRDALVRLDQDELGAEGEYLIVDHLTITPRAGELDLDLTGVRLLNGSSSGQLRLSVPFDRILRVKKPDPEKPKYLTSDQVAARLEAGLPDAKPRWRLEYELARRTALSATYLVFALGGVLMGLRLATESVLGPLGATIGLAGVHHVLYQQVGRDLVLSGQAPAWLGAWLANGVLLAVFVLVVATRRWRR